MRPTVLLLMLLLLPVAHAATLSVAYDINGEATVTNKIELDNEDLTLPLPADATALHLDGDPVSATDAITLRGNGTHYVRYRTSSIREGERHIVIDLAGTDATLGQILITLPGEVQLERPLNSENPSVRPLPTTTRTDGIRHTFIWEGDALEPARAVLITLENPERSALWQLALALALFTLGAGIALYARRFLKRTDEITRNLFGDEKDLVRILDQAGGELWQKELQQRSGLSKVKISRRVRNLEAKGVIEKIPHGNTNRIRLK